MWLDREAVVVGGPDATAYLQGQLSQDMATVEPGASAWSWVLQPAGKVDALVRVTRWPERPGASGAESGVAAADCWVLDTDAGYGEALVARLNRFKLRTKVDIQAPGWRCLGLRGEDVDTSGVRFEVTADARWPGIRGVDLFGPDLDVPAGATLVDPAAYEVTRILAGLPRMGAELTERTIPAETGLVASTVSFTKGCYTGQELVARIDSRGSNVPRHLRRLRAPSAIEAGADLAAGGKVVGTVTSAATTGGGAWVALGYVARSVAPPAVVTAPDGTEVTVEDLA